MNNKWYFLIMVTCTLLLYTRKLSAQKNKIETSAYNIMGTVNDKNSKALIGAHIEVVGFNLGTNSDDNGRFEIKGLSQNLRYELIISHLGYEYKRVVVHSSMANTELHVILQPKFMKLETFVVTPGHHTLNDIKTSSMQGLTKEHLKDRPNFIQDVFRLINALPSTKTTDYNVKPRIRGAHHKETGIYLDNFELINPFHIEISGGVQGLINTDYVEKIEIMPSPYSVKYADRLSGIVSFKSPKYLEGNEFSLSLDLLNAKAFSQVKLNNKWNIMTNLRRGYWDFIIDLESLNVDLVFYDLWNKVNFHASDRHFFSFSFLYGKDRFNYIGDFLNVDIYHYNSQYHRFYSWINWNYSIHDNLFLTTTVGRQGLKKASDFDFSTSSVPDNVDNYDFKMTTMTSNLEWKLNSKQQFSVGIEGRFFKNKVLFRETRIDNVFPIDLSPPLDTIFVDTELTSHILNFCGEYTYQWNDKWVFQAALRLSDQGFTENFNFSPRLSVRHEIDDNWTTTLGWGILYQSDNYNDMRSELGQSEMAMNNARADHYSFNLSYDSSPFFLDIDAFFKDYKSFFDDYRLLPSDRIESFKTYEESFRPEQARSYGFELSAGYTYKNGSVTVAYAFNDNKIENKEGHQVSRAFEVPHEFNLNYIHRFKKNYTLAAAFSWRSGFPYTEVDATRLEFVDADTPLIIYRLEDKFGERHPSYKSVDLRISKKWINKKTQTEVYLNFLNIFNFSNVRNIYYEAFKTSRGNVNEGRFENEFFPIFVTPGVKFSF